MLAGLEHISAGQIRFGDKVVNALAPKDRDIAMVFENYALYPHKTVFDNMANPLKRANVAKPEIERRVSDAAKLLEIGHLLARRPQELSGGQKQRVAIGRAIVRQPQVFLFDEPIAHLDAKLRARMRGELKHLQLSLGVTTIYVTHDQLEALSMADRIAVMNDGVLQQFDTPKAIYEHPANAWVATFVGEPQMSLMEMAVAEQDGQLTLVLHGHRIPIDDRNAARIRAHGQPTVLVGVRPDKVMLSMQPSPRGIPGEVFARQLLGSDMLVEMEVGENRIRAKTGTDFDGSIGDPCYVTLNSAAMHIFSAASGDRLDS
jgi:multiple sugar transport system ATP-binding protein